MPFSRTFQAWKSQHFNSRTFQGLYEPWLKEKMLVLFIGTISGLPSIILWYYNNKYNLYIHINFHSGTGIKEPAITKQDPTISSLVVNREKMRACHCIPFSAFKLMVSWQEVHQPAKKPCYTNAQRFCSATRGRGGPDEELNNPCSLGKWLLNRSSNSSK